MGEVGCLARVRVDVAASGPVIKWADVHGPARAVAYGLIGASDPELARELHDHGWQGSSLKPLGISPPLFMRAPKRKGVYTTSETGSVWLGSPVPRISAALLKGISSLSELQWGGTTLKVQGKELEWPDDYEKGTADFASASPVLLKLGPRFLLPGDSEYGDRLLHNLRHKADVLGLPSDVRVEVLESGPKRIFEVGGAKRIGANIRLRVTADPAFLRALTEWGIGLNTVQGFGWLQ